MITAHYIGDHRQDALSVRAGWWLTRLVQFGEFSHVTHSEAISCENLDGSVSIGSASVRDKGVRVKTTHLNPANCTNRVNHQPARTDKSSCRWSPM